MPTEITKEELMTGLGSLLQDKRKYEMYIYHMDRVKDEDVYVTFTCHVARKKPYTIEPTENTFKFEIPHELNEQIYHLVHNYYFRKNKEIESLIDDTIKLYAKIEQNKKEDNQNGK